MDPRDHAAVVTGGASGLGEETAIRLARAGAKVAVFDLNGEAARKAASTIGGIGIECDVSDPDSTTTAFKQAREKHGPTRIVVNCAGIGTAKRIVGRDGPMPLNDFQQVISVNLIGTFNVMRLAAAEMTTLDTLDDNERGVIISTASIAAFEGQIGQAAYAASKGGVVALTVPAAREFAQFGIRVMAIAPGLF
jgi:NAD(P)-dependent dehydrogenase (short-subunit alcohol dehydrogenase family)